MSIEKYQEFLRNKQIVIEPSGFEPREPNPMLYDFQRDIVKWALRRGKAAVFADCGMGKTMIAIEWANQVPGNILILAPLNVAKQTVHEAEKLGTTVNYCRKQEDVVPGITITNYEMMDHFDETQFEGIILDESSILKNFTGKFRNALIAKFKHTPYKLCCTATPAPNDHMELGNHAEFLGAMSRTEMLSMFFVHDGGDTSKWRIKGHAEQEFWKWVCSWAVMLRKPSDLGYDDGRFILPALNLSEITVEPDSNGDYLVPMEAKTLQERITARRVSINARCSKCAEMVNNSTEEWVVWCGLNNEGDTLEKLIPGSVQVSGSDSLDDKIQKLEDFAAGKIRVLITKPSVAGMGSNWQHCRNQSFVGLSDSWEEYYQAVRRCWRFGQEREVNVFIIISSTEGQVLLNIKRKEADAAKMAEEMVKHMHSMNEEDIKGTHHNQVEYKKDTVRGDNWVMHLGDCVEVVSGLKSESVHFSIFSPPFASLYTYSASDRDMGNSKNHDEFAQHFQFLVKELYRVLIPGRLISFHCMNLPTSKTNHGFIGIRDFRGELVKAFEKEGFIFHSEVCIWKDPVTAMQRTKALGLLHKQMVKDSCMSRQGIPDYLVTMRKPGENPQPVSGELDRWIGDDSFKSDGRLSIDLWQRYASPVWMDINPSRTLQKASAREDKDERHICPLQLDVIERAMELWTNPGDVVLSPFAGIGSEGYVALQQGRKFVGVELKHSYWKQACANLVAVKQVPKDLIDLISLPCEETEPELSNCID